MYQRAGKRGEIEDGIHIVGVSLHAPLALTLALIGLHVLVTVCTPYLLLES